MRSAELEAEFDQQNWEHRDVIDDEAGSSHSEDVEYGRATGTGLKAEAADPFGSSSTVMPAGFQLCPRLPMDGIDTPHLLCADCGNAWCREDQGAFDEYDQNWYCCLCWHRLFNEANKLERLNAMWQGNVTKGTSKWSAKQWVAGDPGFCMAGGRFRFGDIVALSESGLDVQPGYKWEGQALVPKNMGIVFKSSGDDVHIRGSNGFEDVYDPDDIVETVIPVKVVTGFKADNRKRKQIRAGATGSVIRYDDHGDALVAFSNHEPSIHWVLKGNIQHLSSSIVGDVSILDDFSRWAAERDV